jgi:hypothetical protein
VNFLINIEILIYLLLPLFSIHFSNKKKKQLIISFVNARKPDLLLKKEKIKRAKKNFYNSFLDNRF